MISIAEMKEIAQKEVKAEKELAKIKFDKDLAMYRNRLKEVKPELMEYIEKCIYNGLKRNKKIELYTYAVDEIFKSVNKYGNTVLYYLADSNRAPVSAYDVALKELADDVREELYNAGVKCIVTNDRYCFMGEPYLFLEV